MTTKVKLEKSFSAPFAKNTSKEKEVGLGLEIEIPVVTLDGSPGDNRKIFAQMAKLSDWDPLFGIGLSGENIVKGYKDKKNRMVVVTEAGICTIEVNVPRCTNLYDMYDLIKTFMRRLVEITKQSGQLLLGYGIQPNAQINQKSLQSLWFPLSRYHALRDTALQLFPTCKIPKDLPQDDGMLLAMFSNGVNNVPTTASLQPHYELENLEQGLKALNVFNVLTPVFMILFRNAAVYGGQHGKVYASREAIWKAIHPTQTGLYSQSFQDMDDLLNCFLDAHVLVRPNGSGYVEVNQQLKNVDPRYVNEGLLSLLKGTFWKVGRITEIPTFEFRPICASLPGRDLEDQCLPMMESVAMFTGLMHMLNQVNDYICKKDFLPETIQKWYWQSLCADTSELLQDTDFRELMITAIDYACIGLRGRGANEILLLSDLQRKKILIEETTSKSLAELMQNSAAIAFEDGGLSALLNVIQYR